MDRELESNAAGASGRDGNENRHSDAILDSATEDAIVALNLGGEVIRWNAGAERITGYLAAEIVGRSAGLIFTPEDRASGAFEGELRLARERGRAPNERWHVRRNGSRFWASGAMLPLFAEGGRVEGYVNTFRDHSALQAENERHALIMGEMSHRIRNLLALVQSIATQTVRTAAPEAFLSTFEGRLAALARSQDMLGTSGEQGAGLRELLKQTLTFLGDEADRVTLEGPEAWLPGDIVQMLSLAVHELATNAVKHGALSVPEGGILVSWRRGLEPEGTRVVELAWREVDGPPVEAPSRTGFGSQLLQRGLGRSRGTTVALDYARDGLVCRIRMPL